jgi:hypothetical protein
VEVVKKKEKDRVMKLRKPSKLVVFWVSSPVACYLRTFVQLLFESQPVYDQTQGTGAVFSWL